MPLPQLGVEQLIVDSKYDPKNYILLNKSSRAGQIKSILKVGNKFDFFGVYDTKFCNQLQSKTRNRPGSFKAHRTTTMTALSKSFQKLSSLFQSPTRLLRMCPNFCLAKLFWGRQEFVCLQRNFMALVRCFLIRSEFF